MSTGPTGPGGFGGMNWQQAKAFLKASQELGRLEGAKQAQKVQKAFQAAETVELSAPAENLAARTRLLNAWRRFLGMTESATAGAESSSASSTAGSAFRVARGLGTRGVSGAVTAEVVVVVVALVVIVAIAWHFYNKMQQAEAASPQEAKTQREQTQKEMDEAYRAWQIEVQKRVRIPRVAH